MTEKWDALPAFRGPLFKFAFESNAMDTTDESPAAGLKVELSEIHPCPDNNVVYGVQSLDDPDIVALIEFDPFQRDHGSYPDQRR